MTLLHLLNPYKIFTSYNTNMRDRPPICRKDRSILSWAILRVIALVLTATIISDIQAATPIVTVAPLSGTAPMIDGRLDDEAWGEAAIINGMQWGKNLAARTGQVWVTLDTTYLYLAARTELPPSGSLRTTMKRDGANVVFDDSLEIWLKPPQQGRPEGTLGQGYFQLIVNSTGVAFGRHWEPGYGLSTLEWKPAFKMKSQLVDGFWDAEIAIPLKDLGLEQLVLPAEFRFNLARNWKEPWTQANITSASAFTDVSSMLRLHVRAKTPSVRVLELGDLRAGQAAIVVEGVRQQASQEKLTLQVKLEVGDEVLLNEQKVLLAEGQSKHQVVWHKTFKPASENHLTLNAFNSEGEIVYQRNFTFKPEPSHRWTQLEQFLGLHQDFEGSTLTAKGLTHTIEPVETSGSTPAEGFDQTGRRFPPGATLTYPSENTLTVPGAVSFWIKLERERVPNTGTLFWFMPLKGGGQLGMQDTLHAHLQIWLHNVPGLAPVNVLRYFPWQQGRWYHMLANLHTDRLELYLDGEQMANAKLAKPLRTDMLNNIRFGGGAGGYVLDDIRLHTRALNSEEVRKLAMGEETIQARIGYFPSKRALSTEMFQDGEVPLSDFNLVVSDINETQEFLRKTISKDTWQPQANNLWTLRTLIPLPNLKPGRYRAWIEGETASDAPARPFGRKVFHVKSFPWEDCTLGMSQAIIPPFTPLQVTGDVVRCILREHQLGNLGLWRQVESAGQPLLARPIALTVEAGGQTLNWETGKVEIVEAAPHRVITVARSSVPGLEASVECTYDYDGFMLVNLTLEPLQHQPLDRITLDIPLRPEVATLFHASGEHIRANPAGLIPEGTGRVWGSRSIPQSSIDNFIPYIWAGGPKRGICWAADWDKDWVHSTDRDAVELVREDDALTIRINLFNGTQALERKRTITFGLQASPVKPMPENWRAKTHYFDHPGRGINLILWPTSWGGHYGWHSRYPLDEDFSLIEKINEARETGHVDQDFLETWVKRVLEHPGTPGKVVNRDSARGHVNFAFHNAQAAFRRTPRGKLLFYSCAAEGAGGLPEYEVYADEWQYDGKNAQANASFANYAVYYADRMMQHGMDGIYVDNTFTVAKQNWPMGEGYIDDNGEVQPNLGLISRTRQLIKRLAVMMHEQGREPFVYVHMTNANLLPVLSFAQANLGWEYKYGGNDYQERFSPAYIRAVNHGRQSGTIPLVLGGLTSQAVKEDENEHIRVSRTALAMVLPHEMFIYSAIHSPTAIRAREIIASFWNKASFRGVPYWDQNPVIQSPETLLVTTYVRDHEMLLVIGNQSDAGTFPIKILTAPPRNTTWQAVNAETGERLPVVENVIQIPIKRHDFNLIKLLAVKD